MERKYVGRTRALAWRPRIESLKANRAMRLSDSIRMAECVNSPEIKWQTANDKSWWGWNLLIGPKSHLDLRRPSGGLNNLNFKPHLCAGKLARKIEMKDWGIRLASGWELRDFIFTDYAILAEEQVSRCLCVGQSWRKTSPSRAQGTAKKSSRHVRKVLIQENWSKCCKFTSFEQNQFGMHWSYIGFKRIVSTLPKSHNPNLKNWPNLGKCPSPKSKKVVRKFQKPVFFTEIVNCNTVRTLRIDLGCGQNERTEKFAFWSTFQALCYEAFFWDRLGKSLGWLVLYLEVYPTLNAKRIWLYPEGQKLRRR